ncbi:MAG: hypothetical protein K2Q18_03620, partial [Bdellovibrionales bacterium]|nr:hypothetical protein [Bdellovibrionales bacterium]
MKFLISFLILASTAAFSGDRDTAYNLICKPLPFESERTKCIEIIKPSSYFNDEVLAMCAEFPFTQTKMTCLGFIGNKNYAA